MEKLQIWRNDKNAIQCCFVTVRQFKQLKSCGTSYTSKYHLIFRDICIPDTWCFLANMAQQALTNIDFLKFRICQYVPSTMALSFSAECIRDTCQGQTQAKEKWLEQNIYSYRVSLTKCVVAPDPDWGSECGFRRIWVRVQDGRNAGPGQSKKRRNILLKSRCSFWRDFSWSLEVYRGVSMSKMSDCFNCQFSIHFFTT